MENICKNCKSKFILPERGMDICKKLNVPFPDQCRECMFKQRMSWRNENTLYKRPNNTPDSTAEIISIYSKDSPVVVYDQDYWNSDKWDPKEYGQDYDFSESFFKQFYKLYTKVPWPNIRQWNCVNSIYDNHAKGNKNCYMTFGGTESENCGHSTFNFNCKDTWDVYFSTHLVNCYECVDCHNCYNVRYSRYVRNSTDSYFLYDCVNCSNCIGCVNLRNAKYCIFNEQYSKEEYEQIVKDLDFGNYQTIQELSEKFVEHKNNFPKKFAVNINCQNTNGDNSAQVSNSNLVFDVEGPAENLEDVFTAGFGAKDSFSVSHFGYNADLSYNSFGIFSSASRVICSLYCPTCVNVSYSYNCVNCQDCFGCVGIKNGKYMIFNKQYSKEDYFEMVEKIKKHMNDLPYKDKNEVVYTYGNFFPSELSPFGYNETIAQEYFPKEKEKALGEGFNWYDKQDNVYKTTLKASDIVDSINDIDESVLKEVIECTETGKAFRIVPMEFEFYKRLKIPIPRIEPKTRHYKRINSRNGLLLRNAICDCAGDFSKNGIYKNSSTHEHKEGFCDVEFMTTHPDDEKNILYCEKCYNKEVY